jgi:hypothetical protein
MSEQNLPSGLGCSGMRLWEAAAELYEMNPGEIALLEQVCRTADELDRLESAVQGLPELTTTGSTGQVRPHPLLQEVRAHRLLLERLTTALGLPDGAGGVWVRLRDTLRRPPGLVGGCPEVDSEGLLPQDRTPLAEVPCGPRFVHSDVPVERAAVWRIVSGPESHKFQLPADRTG